MAKGESAIGYWSSAADAKHTSVVVKWIIGNPYTEQFMDSQNQAHWVWENIPSVTALNCTPVFETANASVMVKLETAAVQDYTIIGTPIQDSNAWSTMYQQDNVSSPRNPTSQNISVR